MAGGDRGDARGKPARRNGAEAEFLKISVNAFDPQHAGSDPVEYLVSW